MNNSTYNAYTLLEELSELAQATVKCIRWGEETKYKESWFTNREKMLLEYNDVIAMLELLTDVIIEPSPEVKTDLKTILSSVTKAQAILEPAIEENLHMPLIEVVALVLGLGLPKNPKQVKSKKQRVAVFKEYSIARGILEINRKIEPTTELIYHNWLSTQLQEKYK